MKILLTADGVVQEIVKAASGLPSVMLFTLLLTVFFFWVFKKGIAAKIGNMKIPNMFKKKKMDRLLMHDFFMVCDDISNKVKTMDFREDDDPDDNRYPIKTKLLRILIERKMEVVKEDVIIFLKQEGIDKFDSNEIKFKFKTTLGALVDRYNQDCYKIFIEMGISHEDAWYFINRYEAYRTDCIEGFVDRLDSIATNQDYSSNFDKLIAILELCSLAMAIIPRDIMSVYTLINGRFKKYDNLN